MQRLTVKRGKYTYGTQELLAECRGEHPVYFCSQSGKCDKKYGVLKERTCPALKIMDCLAAYEDLSFTPEELAEMIEKQQPHRVVYNADWNENNDAALANCPHCATSLCRDEKYCPECSYCLDWEE